MIIRVNTIKKYFLAIVMLFLTIRPQFIITLFPENGMRVMSYADLILVILLGLFSMRGFVNILKDKHFIIVTILYIYIWILTRVSHGTVGLALYNGISVVSAVIFIKYFENRYGYVDCIKYFNMALSTFIWVNLITMYVFPDGIVRSNVHIYNSVPVFFLGQVNQFTVHLILSAILFIIQKLNYPKFTLGNVLLQILPLILTILNDVATTAIVAIAIMIAGLVTVKILPNIIRKIERPILNTILVVIAFFLISRLLSLPIVANVITNILGKDVTLASRTSIWEQAFSLLRDPSILIWGKGEISGSAYVSLYSGATFSTHNLLLQVCFLSGLVGLLLFCAFFYISIYRIEKMSKVYKRAVLAICMLAFCLINMTEVYTFPMIYFTILMFDCAGYMLNDNVIEKNTEGS